jgi:hypothetical protein
MDFTHLRNLLQAKDWQAADEATAKCMMDAMESRLRARYLEAEDIINFPCEALRKIDQLWIEASRGRFGFSVQAQIWRSCGSPTSYFTQEWNNFGVMVGWRLPDSAVTEPLERRANSIPPEFKWNQAILDIAAGWLPYSQLTFSDSAPIGHLPVTGNRVANRGGPLLIAGRHPFHDSMNTGERARRPLLFSRIETCS